MTLLCDALDKHIRNEQMGFKCTIKREKIMEMGVGGFFLKGMGLLEDQFANITN